jgi:acyl-CoA thioesterase
MHPLDRSLELSPAENLAHGEGFGFRCHTSERYRNAIGPFGGWIAALLLRGVLAAPGVRGTPISLDGLFMGAIRDGEIELRVYRLRQNRSVGFWRSEIWQTGCICAHAQVSLSGPRTSIVLKDARFPGVPGPESLPVYDNPRTPVPWLDRYVFKPVMGLIFSQADSMDSRIWIRENEPRAIDAVSLTAICDTPFPPTWIRLKDQSPVSTVAYSVYYRASEADYAQTGDGPVLLDTHASLAQDGYVDQFTSVWNAHGVLLAQTQQMLWFSDRPAARG